MGRGWDAVLGLILTAYIVFRLGAEGYGLWSVVAPFIGYAALFDIGLGGGYSKFIAQHAAHDDHKKMSEVVSTGLFFYLLFGICFLAITWTLVGFLLPWALTTGMFESGDLAQDAVVEDITFLFKWGIAIFVLSNCLAPFNAIQTGLQRMGVTNAISAICVIIKCAATVYFLETGYGVRGLMYANIIVTLIFGAMTIGAAYRLCPQLKVNPNHISRERFRSLFTFGWQTQVSRLANLIMFETDILVITLFLQDFKLVGLYRLGVEIVNKMRQVPVILLSALMPAVSDLDARDQDEKVADLYYRVTKYLALVTFPLAALIFGSAEFIMNAWQGTQEDWGVSVWVIRILVIGYVTNILPGVGIAVVLGKGRPDVQMKSGLISMSANIALTLGLVWTIGFWGIPIATALSMFISWGWFLTAIKSVLNVSTGHLVRSSFNGAVVASIPVALIAYGGNVLSSNLGQRVELILGLVFLGMICALLYLGALRRTGVLDDQDLNFFDHTLGLKRLPGYLTWSMPFRGR
jgi:O-antigen/teichoic acid export membrane protein